MKATLEFDLEDFSEQRLHRRSVNATNAYLAIHTLYQFIRNSEKYRDKKSISFYDLRNQLNKICDEYKIDMDDLE